MKVLSAIPEKFGGVEYHRLWTPLNKLASPDFEVHHVPSFIPRTRTDIWKDYDLCIVSRTIDVSPRQISSIRQIKKHSKLVVDVDDLWVLYKDHALYRSYKKINYKYYAKELLRHADLVTTTTEYLADEICQVTNAPIAILPNAIDPDQPQWKVDRKPSDRLRFGWVGGVHHFPDIAKVRHHFKRIAGLDCEIYLAGYSEQEPVYEYYTSVLSGDYKHPHVNKINAADVHTYGSAYDYFDVAIAPLEDNRFNSCKSELKVIEAGFKGCAVIASAVKPYDLICTEKNSIFTDDYYTAFKRLIDNPNLVEDLSSQLAEDVQKRYHIDVVNKERLEAYESILR